MKSVIVDISPAGSVKVEAQGFKGVGCDKATEQIEISLGGEAGKGKKRKPEFYQAPTTSQSNKLTF